MGYQTDCPIRTASSTTELRAALATLHGHENDLVSRLDNLLSSSDHLHHEFVRLDTLRVTLDAQGIATRSIGNTMLHSSADTASRISNRVRELDLEKNRVEDTLRAVEQVIELKDCVAGIVGSMGAPQDWEAAAGYIVRAIKIPEEVTRGKFAATMVPTIEVPDPPWVTIQNARESLCDLFLKQFHEAAAEGDGIKVTKFFKLLSLIDKKDVGLDAYGQYICRGVANTARTVLHANTGDRTSQNGFFYANALTKLFEQVAHIVESHSRLIEQHYGEGQTVKVIKRLQAEVDVQGGIILDTWSDEKEVDRNVTDAKSYPFSFLAQALLPERASTRSFGRNSPAHGNGVSNQHINQDDELDLKKIDGLLNEMTTMLGRWSLYSQFIASKSFDAKIPGERISTLPKLLVESNLARKVSDRLNTPYRSLIAFFFRHSVEKIFQLNELPTGLSLSKPIKGNPPFIIQAVDDIMYITNNVVEKILATMNVEIITSVIPIVGRVLESDFIGVLHKRMQNESYPRPVAQGGLPSEEKIVGFIVLVNSLDTANEYLSRIVLPLVTMPDAHTGGTDQKRSLKERLLSERDITIAAAAIETLRKGFSSKSTSLLEAGLQALFEEVAKPRTRSILLTSFRDVKYDLHRDDPAEGSLQSDEEMPETVSELFRHGWDALMQPLSRIMTPETFAQLLGLESRYLARLLEKRIWGYLGRVSALGAIRMERDFSSITRIVSLGSYSVGELFARVMQILMIANMDEEEWEEVQSETHSAEEQWVLTQDERSKVRRLVQQQLQSEH